MNKCKGDLSYVGDIFQGTVNMLDRPPQDDGRGGSAPARVYNIGNNQPEDLLYFVETREKFLIAEGIIVQPAHRGWTEQFCQVVQGILYQRLQALIQ